MDDDARIYAIPPLGKIVMNASARKFRMEHCLPAPELGETILSVNEAASIAKCTQVNIQNAIKRENLPALKVMGRWLIKRADFDIWLSSPRKVGRPKKEKAE